MGYLSPFLVCLNTRLISLDHRQISPPSYLSLTGVVLSLAALAVDFYRLQSREVGERMMKGGGREAEGEKRKA